MQVLAKYNALWQLLLRLRRGRAALDTAWHLLMDAAPAKGRPEGGVLRLLALRLSLAHLLSALQSHLQVRAQLPILCWKHGWHLSCPARV